MKRKIIGILSVSVMVFMLMVDPSLAFSGIGEGIKENPYKITSWTELNETRNEKDAYYKLLKDLHDGQGDYISSWNPIENFTGNFNGDGHRIMDTSMYKDGEEVGFIAYSDGCTVKDLILKNIDVDGKDGVGGLIGRTSGEIGVTNISGVGVVDSEITATNGTAGGIAGGTTQITINESYADAIVTSTVDGGKDASGGIAGSMSINSQIENSYTTGKVNGTMASGGLIGVGGTVNITDSYSTAEVGNATFNAMDSSATVVGIHGDEALSTNRTLTLTNVYGNSEVGNQDTVVNVEPNTGNVVDNGYKNANVSEMTYPYASDVYEGWDMSEDFNSIWLTGDHKVVEDVEGNTGYPTLSRTTSDAYFNISIINTTTPVKQGEEIQVDYKVTNNGDVSGTSDIILTIDGSQKDIQYNLIVGAGETQQFYMTWNTTGIDAGTYTATVSATDVGTDSDSTTLEVNPTYENYEIDYDYYTGDELCVEDPTLTGIQATLYNQIPTFYLLGLVFVAVSYGYKKIDW